MSLKTRVTAKMESRGGGLYIKTLTIRDPEHQNKSTIRERGERKDKPKGGVDGVIDGGKTKATRRSRFFCDLPIHAAS